MNPPWLTHYFPDHILISDIGTHRFEPSSSCLIKGAPGPVMMNCDELLKTVPKKFKILLNSYRKTQHIEVMLDVIAYMSNVHCLQFEVACMT